MHDGLAVGGVLGGCRGRPEVGEGRGGCPQVLYEVRELGVGGVAGRGVPEVGDDRCGEGFAAALGVEGTHRGVRGPVAEDGAGEVAFGDGQGGGIALQGAPHGVPPHQTPVGGEHPDRDISQACGESLDARRHMCADRPVLRRQQPGAPVQLVALGPGQLQGPCEGTDDLGRGMAGPPLLQTQDVVDGETGELSKLLTTQPRRPPADPHGVTGVSGERRSRQACRSEPKSDREAAIRPLSPPAAAAAWVLPVLPIRTALVGGRSSGECG